jgi:hypothetical protein
MKRAFAVAGLVLMLCVAGANAGSFEAHHPDQYFRQRGAVAFDAGRYEAALKDFRRAARYADKAAQLALALAYWNGDGAAVDPPTAYAWADVAAERGYPAFLATRERMWNALDARQRTEALAIGAKLYRTYGDAVAKRRLESHMKRGLVQKTGTRTGSQVVAVGVAPIDFAARAALRAGTSSSMAGNVGPAGGHVAGSVQLASRLMTSIAAFGAEGYYGDDRWVPKVYWRRQDRYWKSMDEGVVEVGPISKAD